jgi:hypothetical protein
MKKRVVKKFINKNAVLNMMVEGTVSQEQGCGSYLWKILHIHKNNTAQLKNVRLH